MKAFTLLHTHRCKETRNSDRDFKSVLQTIEEHGGNTPLFVEKVGNFWYVHEIEVSEHTCPQVALDDFGNVKQKYDGKIPEGGKIVIASVPTQKHKGLPKRVVETKK